jgi:hypothetical protein
VLCVRAHEEGGGEMKFPGINRRHRRASRQLVATMGAGQWSASASAKAGYYMHASMVRLLKTTSRAWREISQASQTSRPQG